MPQEKKKFDHRRKNLIKGSGPYGTADSLVNTYTGKIAEKVKIRRGKLP